MAVADKRRSTLLATLGVLIALVAANTTAWFILRGARIDVTEEKLYTVSPGVNAIAASAQERQASLKMSSDVALVVAVLREEGADVGICVRRRDVVRQSKLPVKRVTAAIAVMQLKSPAWVEVVSERVAIGNGAKREVVSFLLTKWAPD